MKIAIDKVGRIIIPKRLRDRFGMRPNDQLEIVEHPDGLLIRRVGMR